MYELLFVGGEDATLTLLATSVCVRISKNFFFSFFFCGFQVVFVCHCEILDPTGGFVITFDLFIFYFIQINFVLIAIVL